MEFVLGVAPQQVEPHILAVDRDRNGHAIDLGLPDAPCLLDFQHRLDGLSFAVETDAPAPPDPIHLRIQPVEPVLGEVVFLGEGQPCAIDWRHAGRQGFPVGRV